MSWISFAGAIELGLIYACVSLGVFIAFRVLNFPDLTADGSFPLGASVTAILIVHGHSPWAATIVAVLAGGLAGLVTAVLTIRFGILNLLAGILTMTALFSVNLRLMGAPNIALLNEETILSPARAWGLPMWIATPMAMAIGVVVIGALLTWFLKSEFGLAMRATGANPRMSRAQGVSTDLHTYVGLALTNALIALGGALFAQSNGFADVTLGTGTIIIGLAAVILGETIFRTRSVAFMVIGAVVGAIVYRLAVSVALNSDWLGLTASDLNLVTAVLVALALMLPKARLGRLAKSLRTGSSRPTVAQKQEKAAE
ncbi:ABC transporter permease [Mesorhizobium sp. B2-4-17]|nr:ABC transporter permease [Mesorhizobium sp. B2-4-17]